MKEIIKLLLYGGQEREDFDLLAEDARAENARSLLTYTMMAVLVFAGLLVANARFYALADINQAHYLAMMLVNLCLYLCQRWLSPRHPWVTLPLCYVFMIALYVFSLALTALHPELPAVTSIVLLFAVPFMMIDRPIRLAALTMLAAAGLFWVSIRFKSGSIARMDLWNGASFAAVAAVVETLQQRSKYRMLSQARKIRLLSETDLLTGVKNRNHYENRLASYASDCATGLVCVYVDVNGLHELNNAKGHKAGDAMLQAVARELVDCFSPEHTYRIGGDEFVCFRADAPEYPIRGSVERIQARLAVQGYHISAGIASQVKSALDMNVLTSAAENAMYQNKRAFYAQEGRDRRRR